MAKLTLFKPILWLTAIALLPPSPALLAGSLLLRGATVHTVSDGAPKRADVLVRDGRIAAVAEQIDEQADEVVDLAGMHLFPGLISAVTELGLVEISGVRATVDTREVGDHTPEVDAWLAVNPDSELIPVARANGLTHFAATPQGRLLAGASGLMACGDWTIEDMAVSQRSGMHLYWPGHSLNLPGGASGDKVKPLDEQARERREKIREIERFFADAEAWAKLPPEEAATAPAWQAMLPVLEGKLPLMIHAQGRREIRAALDWAAERPKLRITLVGGRDARWFATELAERKIPVIFTEVFTLPVNTSDAYDIHFSTPAALHEAGVEVAIGDFSASGQRNLPYSAAQASAFGLPAEAALAAITLVPARVHGVADRLGSIEPGKEASFFAATGNILDIRSEIRRLWIAGVEQSLENRHTRLAERYRARPAK
jgi:imidazolonepropionase-like amidohydrolase